MMQELSGTRVAFVVSNEGIEQAELTEPWKAVEQSGGSPVLAAKESGEAQAFRHLDRGDRFTVNLRSDQLDPDAFDALVIPGGVANADQLRMDGNAIAFVEAMFRAGKPAAVICHGPWVLVEGDLVRGRTLTSWPSLQTDIRNAGGTWVDQEVHACTAGPNSLVTSRKPDDLPAFCREMVRMFAGATLRA
jgi:protease I